MQDGGERCQRAVACVLCRAPAALYCRNDDAFLCSQCDIQVHGCIPALSSHERVPTFRDSTATADSSASLPSRHSETLRHVPSLFGLADAGTPCGRSVETEAGAAALAAQQLLQQAQALQQAAALNSCFHGPALHASPFCFPPKQLQPPPPLPQQQAVCWDDGGAALQESGSGEDTRWTGAALQHMPSLPARGGSLDAVLLECLDGLNQDSLAPLDFTSDLSRLQGPPPAAAAATRGPAADVHMGEGGSGCLTHDGSVASASTRSNSGSGRQPSAFPQQPPLGPTTAPTADALFDTCREHLMRYAAASMSGPPTATQQPAGQPQARKCADRLQRPHQTASEGERGNGATQLPASYFRQWAVVTTGMPPLVVQAAGAPSGSCDSACTTPSCDTPLPPSTATAATAEPRAQMGSCIWNDALTSNPSLTLSASGGSGGAATTAAAAASAQPLVLISMASSGFGSAPPAAVTTGQAAAASALLKHQADAKACASKPPRAEQRSGSGRGSGSADSKPSTASPKAGGVRKPAGRGVAAAARPLLRIPALAAPLAAHGSCRPGAFSRHAADPSTTEIVIPPYREGETRAEKLARYRAKKLRRRFQHTVRYQCRKHYADRRPRIKGRFVSPEEFAAWKLQEQGSAASNSSLLPTVAAAVAAC